MKTTITRAELKQLLDKNNIMVIDVRSKDEYNEKHIPFAGNLPIEIIEAGNFIPEPSKIIITACGKGGGRSERAAKYLRENCNNEVYFLEAGTFGWVENEN
ncbi:MAG: rhodanese-like domain-containing protein [Bacteroidetes bacterium]|nr:rhodanese-like domain-containing protein [Bacteroidota bacterium]